jgi:hypothetical protein
VTPAVEAQAEPVKISWTASGALASWRRILAQTIGDKRPNLERASIEILCLAKAEPGSKPAIVDQLAEMAVAAGIDDDEAQAIFARAVKAPRSVAELSIRKNASVTFPLRAFDSVRLQTERRNYLVKGLLANTGLAVIWGPPKCGKSFWAADLGMHIALGWDYRGHKVQQATVVYAALEGRHGFPARVEAFRRHHNVGQCPVLFTHSLARPGRQVRPTHRSDQGSTRRKSSGRIIPGHSQPEPCRIGIERRGHGAVSGSG